MKVHISFWERQVTVIINNGKEIERKDKYFKNLFCKLIILMKFYIENYSFTGSSMISKKL